MNYIIKENIDVSDYFEYIIISNMSIDKEEYIHEYILERNFGKYKDDEYNSFELIIIDCNSKYSIDYDIIPPYDSHIIIG